MFTSQQFEGVRVAVIGGGAIGSVLTYRLAQAGAEVSLVEQAFPGAGTSSSSFAWLNAFGKQPRDYYRLNLRSIRDHQDLQDELNGNWLTRTGAWHWADSSGANYCSDLPSTIRRLRSWGARVETFAPKDVAHLEPALAFGSDVDEVFLVRDEGWLQASLMIQAVLSAARTQYGATVIRDRVVALTTTAEAVDKVNLASGGSLDVDMVVVAAGPQTAELAALVGTKLPLELTYGFFAVTAPAPSELRRAVIGPRVIARPDGGGRIILGAEEVLSVNRDDVVTQESAAMNRLMDAASRMLPDLDGVPIECIRRGTRVVPVDGYPVVGWDCNTAGVYYVVTHSGITLSAGLANLVVDDLLTSGSDVLDPYRPSRFD